MYVSIARVAKPASLASRRLSLILENTKSRVPGEMCETRTMPVGWRMKRLEKVRDQFVTIWFKKKPPAIKIGGFFIG